MCVHGGTDICFHQNYQIQPYGTHAAATYIAIFCWNQGILSMQYSMFQYCSSIYMLALGFTHSKDVIYMYDTIITSASIYQSYQYNCMHINHQL